MDLEPVIGLEVHAQLLTSTKIFCSCSTQFGNTPNSQTCPVCLGMPGVLPVLNRKVVEYSLKTAIATNCKIQIFNQFARKNYFYPDLPKGYQISQFELPIATGGYVDVESGDGNLKRIGITRIHMEEDAGKLVHGLEGATSESSYVDFNRTGVPLMEIVSEPDIRTPEEASHYLKALRTILQYLDVCDGNMEQGSFRCDANISLRPRGRKEFGTKVELKNMNSFRHVVKALEYEIQRQQEMIEDGEVIVQETRLWNEAKGVSFSMRTKENAHDYRYFPDPDLVPVVIDDGWIEEVKKQLPELPDEKVKRFCSQYKLPEYDAKILCACRQLADYFEKCVGLCNSPKSISNWIMGDILRCIPDPREIKSFAVTPEHLSTMVKLIDESVISGKIAKTVFDEMMKTGQMPEDVVRKKGLIQLSDKGEIEKIIMDVISKNIDRADQFRQGKEKLFGFFVGQVMRASKGKANPGMVNDLLRKKLSNG